MCQIVSACREDHEGAALGGGAKIGDDLVRVLGEHDFHNEFIVFK